MAVTFMRATLAGLGDIIMAAGTTSRNGGRRLARSAQASYDVSAGVFLAMGATLDCACES
jgi:hypothetical protein